DKVGIHDNFFDLGGNSLLMVQLHAQLREALKLDVPLVELFQAPTIRSLAKLLSRDGSEQPSIEKHQERATKQKQVMDQQKRLLMRMKEGKKNG
ncbi:phosphopantetheine-binding protein, partial [Corallococcus sp. 4LFB]|uniref:phosphopantetheine-binding protein n=1 Tax=Corallococcus sp. 4LFB TaxID=3383249 RepID=UPI003976549C